MSLITTIDEFKLKYGGLTFIRTNKLSPEVLDYYIENYNVDWDYISMYQTLTESFIEKYNDKLSWLCISMYQTLSEAFIEHYIYNVDWWYISAYQTLSESFIIKYKDKVIWLYISGNQTLSDAFIDKYMDKVDWVGLFRNKKITMSYEFIVEHLYDFNLYEASIGNNDSNINRLIKEFPIKYSIDKIAYEFNSL